MDAFHGSTRRALCLALLAAAGCSDPGPGADIADATGDGAHAADAVTRDGVAPALDSGDVATVDAADPPYVGMPCTPPDAGVDPSTPGPCHFPDWFCNADPTGRVRDGGGFCTFPCGADPAGTNYCEVQNNGHCSALTDGGLRTCIN